MLLAAHPRVGSNQSLDRAPESAAAFVVSAGGLDKHRRLGMFCLRRQKPKKVLLANNRIVLRLACIVIGVIRRVIVLA